MDIKKRAEGQYRMYISRANEYEERANELLSQAKKSLRYHKNWDNDFTVALGLFSHCKWNRKMAEKNRTYAREFKERWM